MKSLRNVLPLLIAAIVPMAACDEFPEAPETPQTVRVTINPINWPQYIRLQEQVALQVEVVDDSSRILTEVPLQWTNVAESAASLAGTDAFQRSVTGTGLGKAKIQFTIEGDPFQTVNLQDSIPVVLAGVALGNLSTDTSLASLADTVTLNGAGQDVNGGAVLGTGLTWRVSPGTAVAVAGTPAGDQIRVFAEAEGQDTVYVGHTACQGACEQKVVVTVAQVADTVSMAPGADTVVAEDVVQLTATARDARRFAVASETFTWSSTNEAAATVDQSGVVTADSAGVTAIIAVARSGRADTTTVEVLQSGVMQVQLTDAPADNLASAVLYLGGAYVIDNQATKGRRYIMPDAFQVDLLTLVDTVTVLGDRRVPTGTYGNVFLQVDSAKVTLLPGLTFGDGTTSRTLTMAEGQDSLAAAVNGSATVAAGDTAKIVVDFDVDQSFPMSEVVDGVVADVAFDPTTRTMNKQDAAEVLGTVTSLGSAEADSLTLRAVRTDLAGDTLYARTALDGTYKFRYLIPGNYTLTMPQAPACHVAVPASQAVSVAAGQALAGTDFSLDPVTVDSVIALPSGDTINALGYQTTISATAYEGTTPQPGLSFVWSSLDPTIASVDASGVVTAEGTGVARIVAASCSQADTALVTVRQVPATVSVTPTTAEVRAGETIQLVGTLADSAGAEIAGSTFSWTSADTERATVDATTGLVTGVRTGTATITATHGASGVFGSVDVSVLVATVEVMEVSGGMGCMLSASNEVLCWGQNYDGQLGFAATDAYLAHKPSTIALPTTEVYTDIAVGEAHACALTAAGQIYCWGRGWSGELGDGLNQASATPVLVSQPTGESFASVTAGGDFTCATTAANTAYCWGQGGYGQLGNGVAQNRATPTAVFQTGGVDFVQISAGQTHACSLASTGRAQCWGNNERGFLGNNSYSTSYQPVAVTMPTGVLFSDIQVNSQGSCALSTTGDIYCWGLNAGGKIDRSGSTDDFLVPTLVGGGGQGFASLGGGANTVVCGILPSGEALCAGGNYYGQYGNGITWTETNGFEGAATGLTLAMMDGGAWDTMCGLTTAGDPYCWGDKWVGRLGTGERAFVTDPVATSLTGVKSIQQHWNTTCALAGAELRCWEDINHLLGVGNKSNVTLPTSIPLPAGETFEEVAVGWYSVCIRATDGDIYCAGDNWEGQLGNGTNNYSNAWVKALLPSGVTATSLTAGGWHYCVMGSDSTPYCWGDNLSGTLGNGTFEDSNVPLPVSVPSGLSFLTIDAGTEHTCATTSVSSIYCWGWGGNGELGNNAYTESSVPQEVQSAAGFEQVSAGDYTTCALAFDDTAHCWGWGYQGQLGNGTQSESSVPVAVSGGHFFESIESGNGSTICATKADGSVYCWGRGWEGTMGKGIDMTDSTTPVLAMGGLAVQDISGTHNATCVVDLSGNLWCTGRHDHGQTALGVRSYEVVPVRVGGSGTMATASVSASLFDGRAPIMTSEGSQPVRSPGFDRAVTRSGDGVEVRQFERH